MKAIILSLLWALLSPCPTPENFKGEYYWDSQEFGAKLAWDRAEYEFTLDRFEIYRSTDGENFKMVKRIVNTPSITHYECMDIVGEPGRYIYRIVAFYQNECESDPLDTEINVTSVDDHRLDDVALYPNPTTGKVTVASEHMRLIQIVNSLGQTVSQIATEHDNVTIDLAPFGKGVFMMLIHTEKGIVTKNIIVQ